MARSEMTRRDFLQRSASAGAMLAASQLVAQAAPASPPVNRKLGPVIDCHAHLTGHDSAAWKTIDARLIDAADKLGIDQLCSSILCRRPATPEGFCESNKALAEAIEYFPGRILGYCFVNPGHTRAALDEIKRCVLDRGFIGVKLYNEYVCNEPVLYPIVELAIELRVPILQHAGHAHYVMKDQPRISDGGHLAELAKRYPEARLICGHVAGGGDWEWTIKALRHAGNVYLDTSGSVIDEGIIDMAVKVLGADRLLFGCDMSMTAGVGKLRGANLSPEDRQKILGGNMLRLLALRQ